MTRIILLLILQGLVTIVFAQDLIVLKTGEEIASKIFEITPSEIKYKRFDNMNGPQYTVLKNTVTMIKFENGTTEIIKDSAIPVVEELKKNSTIYFLRKSGYAGSMSGYHIFIDEDEICKLNNGKYITREIPAGVHSFSVQFAGAHSKAKAEKLKIQTEPGMTYYIQVTQGGRVMTGDTWCIQIDETAAKELLEKLNKDRDCN